MDVPDEPRIYDTSAVGRRIPEDVTRCVAEVSDRSGWHTYQCPRKRGHGPSGEYCKQHAKIVERREAERRAPWHSELHTGGTDPDNSPPPATAETKQ